MKVSLSTLIASSALVNSRVVAAILVLLFAPFSASALADDSISYIQVQGHGSIKALPDLARFTLELSETNIKLKPTQRNVEKRSAKLLKVLNSFDIKPGSLDSSQITINPRYDYRSNRESPEFLGYMVTARISFVLQNLDDLGGLLEEIADHNVERMHPVQFENSKPSELLDQALNKAIAHSKHLAESIAEQYGVKLGPVLKVEYHTPPIHQGAPRMMRAEMASDGMANAYQQKEIEFNASVNATFRLDE